MNPDKNSTNGINESSNNIYKFNNFLFDADKLALYHQEQLIRNVGEKSLQVLAVLLQNANELASHDEIIGQVWQDNAAGITSINIAQNIRKLRKVFKKCETKEKFIENIKGRGYMFIGNVENEEFEAYEELPFLQSEPMLDFDEAEDLRSTETHSSRSFAKFAPVLAVIVAALLIPLIIWNWQAANDEQEIRRVVEDSQKFESMVLYRKPPDFKEEQLEKYWITETDFKSDFDIIKIREAVQRLVREGRYYGKETKPERFEFQYVEINTSNDFAVVKTLEKWFIVEYLTDGTLHKTKTVGPYFVSYILRKIDGRWLIEKSNTARAKSAPSK